MCVCLCFKAFVHRKSSHFVNYGSEISKVGNATLHIGVSISNSTFHDGFLSTWDRINVMQALEYQLINWHSITLLTEIWSWVSYFLFLWFLFFIFFVDMFSDNSVGARYLPVEIKRKDGGKLVSKTILHLVYFSTQLHKIS